MSDQGYYTLGRALDMAIPDNAMTPDYDHQVVYYDREIGKYFLVSARALTTSHRWVTLGMIVWSSVVGYIDHPSPTIRDEHTELLYRLIYNGGPPE